VKVFLATLLVLFSVTIAFASEKVGEYRDNGPGGVSTIYTVYKDGKSFYLKLKCVGSSGMAITQRLRWIGRDKYRRVGFDDYYKWDKESLSCFDKQGLVFTAFSVK